jgi:hypothetical protein
MTNHESPKVRKRPVVWRLTTRDSSIIEREGSYWYWRSSVWLNVEGAYFSGRQPW